MTATTTTTAVLDSLVESWERQQDAHVKNRSERFGVNLDSSGHARPNLGTCSTSAADWDRSPS